tara:strand:+ start:297 stop:1484 length:1188 start_codon:yes stop_codon:yes gene_type:complete
MVVFIIGCFSVINTGNGGHYYSLLHLAKELPMEYKIIVIGDFFPNAYKKESNIDFINVSVNEVDTFKPKEYLQLHIPSIVHAYDSNSAIFANKIAAEFKVPLVVTKPGGSALKVYAPVYKNMVVFHGEDYDSLNNRIFAKPKKLALIANRVATPLKTAQDKRLNPFESCNSSCIKIIRIARIGKAYKKSILQSIELHNQIKKRFTDRNVFLAIVGHVEDEQVFIDIKKIIQDTASIELFVTPDYCIEASQLIPYSDVVVGTGRSFMEGMSYGKFVFFPVKGSSIPCFTTEESYDKAFYKNFSPRLSTTDGIDPLKALNIFYDYLDSVKNHDSYNKWIVKRFDENHEVKEGAKRLVEFYQNLSPENQCIYLKQYAWFKFEKYISFLRGKLKKILFV